MRSNSARTTAIASMLDNYELIDGGGGRKRERFGRYVVDRPTGSLTSSSRQGTGEQMTGATAGLSSSAARIDYRYEREASNSPGRWLRGDGTLVDSPVSWEISVDALKFELRLTDSGHVGLFPEQADNWQWSSAQVARLVADGRELPRVLNLFAYTGASTLAAAAAGAEVAHVDAARPAVDWARGNAELSGLATAPIRWLVDDARAFVRRELRRGRRYHGVILDPPSYGHGVKGPDWRLERDLTLLLADCRRLLQPELWFLLLSCHTTGVTAARLGEWFVTATGLRPTDVNELPLVAATGSSLPSGASVRWVGNVVS